MLSPGKLKKVQKGLKEYQKRYLRSKLSDLDESGTRIMINTFLTSILGYKELEEIKTEYMIKGTYADYIVQIGGKRHFLVEVKAFSIDLSEKHLRQAIGYGANEGIEWALLTNGRQFQLYKINFGKPLREKLVFETDFKSEAFDLKDAAYKIGHLHRDAVVKGSLNSLWSRTSALDPLSIAHYLFSPQVLNFLRRTLKKKYKSKFALEEINEALVEVICSAQSLEHLKIPKLRGKPRRKQHNGETQSTSEAQGT